MKGLFSAITGFICFFCLFSGSSAQDAQNIQIKAIRDGRILAINLNLPEKAQVNAYFTAGPGTAAIHFDPVIVGPGPVTITGEVALVYNKVFVEADIPLAVPVRNFGGMGTSDGRFNNPNGLSFDRMGDLFIADTGNDRIVKYLKGRNFAMRFGSFSWISNDDWDDDKQPTPDRGGHFNQPSKVAAGNYLFVADTGNDRIVKYGLGGNYLRRLKSAVEGGFDYDNPRGICLDIDGNVLVADTGNDRICLVDADGGAIRSMGSFGWAAGQFNEPWDVTVSKKNTLYIADKGNARVQKMDELGNVDPHFKVDYALKAPVGLASDQKGNVYVADEALGVVLCLNSKGQLLGKAEKLKRPSDISVDSQGFAYISEPFNHKILVYAPKRWKGEASIDNGLEKINF